LLKYLSRLNHKKLMKVGCMQPYFFPYLGYFSLIKYTDIWVVFDTAQFIRHGWVERNRILGPKGNWNYIRVPLKKHHRETKIKDMKIRSEENWKEKIFAQLVHYKKKAPYYKNVINFLEDAFKVETESISYLNTHLLEKTCDYLEISFNYIIFSESNIVIPKINAPDEWALEITKSLKGDVYVNLPGGVKFFDRKKYKENKIDLHFLKIKLKPYDQKQNEFIPGLSIIDVMMFNSPDLIRQILNEYELI
ncbi:MAG: WbqC family protein, partial [Promethearchaeota archaeon]